MAPIAASLSALASSVSALSSTKLAMIPLAAGLAIGTAVGVTYSSSEAPAEPARAVMASVDPAPVVAPPPVAVPDTKPATPVATAKAETKSGSPCEAQTWPYIDAKCRVGQVGAGRKVRVVTAPRASDMPTEAQRSSDLARKEHPGLISGSTVLHTPQPLAEEPKVTKRSAKKRETRRERRAAQQYYQVPSEYGRGDARIVVRPMQFDSYR